MGVPGNNNATPPSPAEAPGAERIDVAEAGRAIGRQHNNTGLDPRITAVIPAWRSGPFFQAGLAGYSDAAMRIIARRQGCPYCVTEALLDRTLLAGGRGFDKADLGDLHDNVPGGDEDHPLACQIMGSDPDEMAAAALKAAEQGRRGDKHYRELAYARTAGPGSGIEIGRIDPTDFDPTEGLGEGDTCETLIDEINTSLPTVARSDRRSVAPLFSFETIDVNLACPVKKIKAKARGGHWLAEPEGAIAILRAVREAVPREIPCTVKLRRSFDDSPEMVRSFERIFDAAYELGYSWATVHARTVLQKYIGPSRWTVLRDLVARRPDRLIFGSGDVWEAADIVRMIAYTGVHAVSVARGCIGNPWIFRQARQLMAGEPVSQPTLDEQRGVLEDHFKLCVSVNGEGLAGRLMRKFAIRFAEHHPRGAEVRKRFIAVGTTAEWMRVLEEEYAEGRNRASIGGGTHAA